MIWRSYVIDPNWPQQDCWLEVSLHPEGPATGQLDQGFLGPKANAELLPKFDVALHASHAALPMVTLKILSYTNVTLTLAGPPCSWGIWVRGPYTKKTECNCQTKKLKSGTKKNWPTDRRPQYNLKLNLRHCPENYRPVLSSEWAPYMRNKESNCHSKKCNIWSPAPKGARHQDEPSVAIYWTWTGT
jgi:hypothetical protein